MDLFALTCRLVDIESITPNEGAVGDFLLDELRRRGFEARKMSVEGTRENVVATSKGYPGPVVVFSTHMDTVPPFIPSSDDATRIYGRGSCDAKGIIAAQVSAAEKLREEGIHVGLLFLVGEERDSLGAKCANKVPIGSRFLVNGEPTENKLAVASKGALRVELTARGKMAHSAYPHTGRVCDRQAGGSSSSAARHGAADKSRGWTMHQKCWFGTRWTRSKCDSGLAKAELLFRLVGPSEDLRRQIVGNGRHPSGGELHPGDSICEVANARRSAHHGSGVYNRCSRPHQLGGTAADRSGIDSRCAYRGEFVEKQQLVGAVEIYCRIAKNLMA